MAAIIEKIYYAIQDKNGNLTCGYNSKTNGLYSSEGRARTQMNRHVRHYERYMNYAHVTPEQKAKYQQYIDDHKANHKIIQVKVVLLP